MAICGCQTSSGFLARLSRSHLRTLAPEIVAIRHFGRGAGQAAPDSEPHASFAGTWWGQMAGGFHGLEHAALVATWTRLGCSCRAAQRTDEAECTSWVVFLTLDRCGRTTGPQNHRRGVAALGRCGWHDRVPKRQVWALRGTASTCLANSTLSDLVCWKMGQGT